MRFLIAIFFAVPAIGASATQGLGLTMVPPSCETPSTALTSELASFRDERFVVFKEHDRNSETFGANLRLVDCVTNQSVFVPQGSHAVGVSVVGRAPTSSPRYTENIMKQAVQGEDLFTFRSLRQLIREEGGDGILVSGPDDYCGCDMANNYFTGATQ